jgi:hypothetical protein
MLPCSTPLPFPDSLSFFPSFLPSFSPSLLSSFPPFLLPLLLLLPSFSLSSLSYSLQVVTFPEHEELTKIIGGSSHALALTASGEIYSWGSNSDNQLGRRNDAFYNVPQKIDKPPGNPVKFTEISAGATSSMALDEEGFVWVWGDNHRGQMGLMDNSDRLVATKNPHMEGVVGIASGWKHCAALTKSGDVYVQGLLPPPALLPASCLLPSCPASLPPASCLLAS